MGYDRIVRIVFVTLIVCIAGCAAAPKERYNTDEVKSAPETALPSGYGILVVDSAPWCNMMVDGRPRGPTPARLQLEAGKHEVLLSNDEFKIRHSFSVDVEAGRTVTRRISFGGP
jgi:hypothetical protein